MELEQFNKGIIWHGGLWSHTTGLTALLCYTPLVLSVKTKLPVCKSRVQWWAPAWCVDGLQSTREPLWAQYSLYLSLLPGAVGAVVCRMFVTHRMRFSGAEKVTGYQACRIHALLALSTGHHASTANDAGGPFQHHIRNSKVRKQLCYCCFSNPKLGLVLVCNF